MFEPNVHDPQYAAGFLTALAYSLAQHNDGKAVMGPFTLPIDDWTPTQDDLEAVFNDTLNDEAHIFAMHTEIRDKGRYLYLWIATTENHESLNDDWEERLP